MMVFLARMQAGLWWLSLSWLLVPAAWGQAASCPPANLEPRLDSTDNSTLLRYLARSVTMYGLTDEIMPQPAPWNRSIPGNQPCYPNDAALAAGGPYDDSLSCNGQCPFVYCPRNFAAEVALLVRLRATFVLSATSSWDQPERFAPGSAYLRAAGQTVARIQAAYDCAGLPRPYVQAAVLENVDENLTCDPPNVPCQPWMKPGPLGTNSGVRDVPIPARVIEEFRDELRRSPADSAYYLDAAGRPRPDLRFNFFRLAYYFWHSDYSPDITQIEGRMWLYYQATCYLDLGYTSLHLGQPKVWGKLLTYAPAERPQALHQIGRLLTRIRAYAARLPGRLPLLLTAEPMFDNQGQPVRFTDGVDTQGRPRLLFDFGLATMRPRETSPALDARAMPNPPDFTCPAINPQALAGTPCANQYLATIDPCHGLNFGPDGGGVTPLGFVFEQSPYIIYFDHGPTLQRWPSGRLAQPDSLWAGNEGTWGWDDSAWFSRDLSDSCQAVWLAYELAHVRSFANGRGFLTMPGRLFNNLGAGLPDHPELGVPDYRLAAHPLVVAAVARAWQPTAARPVLRAAAGQGKYLGACPGSLFRRRWQQLPAWELRVENPDLSSTYSWHISGPAGLVAVCYGAQSRYLPPAAGSYTIELQQHNAALTISGETQHVTLADVPPANPQCVTGATARRQRQAWRQAQPLIP